MQRFRRRCPAGGPGPADTRTRILDAAEALFAERGFAATTVRDVSAAVGLEAGSLYNRFTSKRALYTGVLERGLAPIRQILEELAHSDWTPERLDAASGALMARLADRPQLPRLIAHDALAGGEGVRRLARDGLRPLYARAVATHRGSGPDACTAELPFLLLALHHLVLGQFAAARLLEEVLDEDPLSPGAIARQGRFVKKRVRLLAADRELALEDGAAEAATPPTG